MKYALLFTIMFGLAFVGVVHAQGEDTTVTVEDLEVESVGILPTSPFYFFKEFGRGVQSFFAFNPVAKARLELRFANEKAAELKTVEDADSEDEQAIARALANYQGAQERLAVRLEALRETSENPNIDTLLERVTERSILHEKLLGEIEARHEERAVIKERVVEGIDKIADVVRRAAEKDDPEKFAERVRKAFDRAEEEDLKALRSLEALDRITDRVGDDAKERLNAVRETLQNQARVRIEALVKEDEARLRALLESTPGDKSRRTVVLEEIRVRASDALSTALDRAQDALEEKIADSPDRAEKAAEQMRRAGEMVEKAKAAAREQGEAREAVLSLVTEAERHLAAAREAFDEEKYGEAFGRARAAEVAARNAIRFITHKEETSAIPSVLEQRIQESVELKTRTILPGEPNSNTPDNGVVCTLEFNPVCGADGKTYANRCIAERQNETRVVHEGKCEAEDSSGSDIRLEIEPDVLQREDSVTEEAVVTRSLEADDNGFYPSSEIAVKQGSKVRLTFNVRPTNVYFGGLDFRSDKFKTASVKPGGSLTVEFTADESFEFSSYWPTSSVLKARGKVVVE